MFDFYLRIFLFCSLIFIGLFWNFTTPKNLQKYLMLLLKPKNWLIFSFQIIPFVQLFNIINLSWTQNQINVFETISLDFKKFDLRIINTGDKFIPQKVLISKNQKIIKIFTSSICMRVFLKTEIIENNTHYPRGDKPVMALIQELTARNDYGYIHVEKKGFSLTLHK